ncbi:MAG TPA: NAD(P)H-dependent glycerol-3-phosphate dehydrogenase [Acetobacteraceae bacterium]|jgi:glycerol-3-phosphate dehydrogenase (NAD(P)+)|nr:NAD(P)H-dependent glycerol-3-phosphate dehydrogenase [Acetobacteraceae bacterium]
MSDVSVIGAGTWGIALAIQAARAGADVLLWARDPLRAADLAARGESSRLPGVRLAQQVIVTHDLGRVSGIVLLAVPMQHQRAVLTRLPPGTAPLVVCAKGFETGTNLLPLEVGQSVHPGVEAAVLTGPNFAHEIAAGLPAAAVVAATQSPLRDRVIATLSTPTFRLYGNDDPIGAQVGGAAKNVIAIAAGAVIGAGLGENARAALITRGLAELARLAVALGGRRETVMGLSGLGDLLLTCTGPASRNYSLGVALGRGEKLVDVLAARSAVTEGVATAPALVTRAAGVDLPICTAVAALLEGRTTLRQAITDLLARPLRDE